MFKIQPSDIPAAISNYMCLSIPAPSQNAIDEILKIIVIVILGLIQKTCFAWVDRKLESYKTKRITKAATPDPITQKNIEDEKKISEQISSNEG